MSSARFEVGFSAVLKLLRRSRFAVQLWLVGSGRVEVETKLQIKWRQLVNNKIQPAIWPPKAAKLLAEECLNPVVHRRFFRNMVAT